MGIRPIDENALVAKLEDWRGDKDDVDFGNASDVAYYQAMSRAIRFVKDAPTIDYAPVVHGYWRNCGQISRTQWLHRCSLCGCPQDYAHKFCPNCGAKMDGGGKDV